MSRILSAFLLLFACLTALPAQTPPKIKVLILTGVSNHAWRATTPVIREILEGTGKFDVRVNEEVRGNTLQTFSSYDVLLLNYNDMKNSGLWWDEGARQALLDFVRNGNGLVSYHASNNAFWGWQEFDKLVGGTWRETAGHAPYHAYTVSIVDRDHPITKGMPASFAETDELYHRLSLEPNIHILAAAFDDPKIATSPARVAAQERTSRSSGHFLTEQAAYSRPRWDMT